MIIYIIIVFAINNEGTMTTKNIQVASGQSCSASFYGECAHCHQAIMIGDPIIKVTLPNKSQTIIHQRCKYKYQPIL